MGVRACRVAHPVPVVRVNRGRLPDPPDCVIDIGHEVRYRVAAEEPPQYRRVFQCQGSRAFQKCDEKQSGYQCEQEVADTPSNNLTS